MNTDSDTLCIDLFRSSLTIKSESCLTKRPTPPENDFVGNHTREVIYLRTDHVLHEFSFQRSRSHLTGAIINLEAFLSHQYAMIKMLCSDESYHYVVVWNLEARNSQGV